MHMVHLETGQHLYGAARQVKQLAEGRVDSPWLFLVCKIKKGLSICLLVEPDKPELLSEALLQLLQDGTKVTVMGAAVSAFLRQKFAPLAVVSGNVAIYEQVLRSLDER